ncbi:response regulator transcription factor [Luteimonas viscosa]|uniref:response regulator transcription factor n=1 Tax=Luteimonas viscosa TaxID=1132694 RepID=UPI001CA42715|nr:response regulator [Luteimonas viscosa]
MFVVDDDPDVRVALDRLLRASGWQVKAYASAGEFLDGPPRGGRGCVLLDVNLPGMSGPELHERILERGIAYPVVYLTGNCTLSTGVRAMKAGALDLLEKPFDEVELLRVVELAITRDADRLTSAARLDGIRGRLARLSPREREVMDHVVAGRLNKQIASDLGIAEKTVKVHRGRVMAKMEVRSVAQLVHLCDELAASARH